LGAKAFFLKAFSEAKALNLADLTAQGELYFVAAFLAAASVGELLESLLEGRTKPKNKLAVVMMTVAILGTLVVAFAAVVEFASVAAAASANKNIDEAFVWDTSLWTFVFAVVTSCACVVFTA
jgi:hypothetical protein